MPQTLQVSEEMTLRVHHGLAGQNYFIQTSAGEKQETWMVATALGLWCTAGTGETLHDFRCTSDPLLFLLVFPAHIYTVSIWQILKEVLQFSYFSFENTLFATQTALTENLSDTQVSNCCFVFTICSVSSSCNVFIECCSNSYSGWTQYNEHLWNLLQSNTMAHSCNKYYPVKLIVQDWGIGEKYNWNVSI